MSSVQPPMVQFTSVGRKDSLNNVEATGEFVVNFAAEPLFEQVNATGTNFPPEVDEFAAVGLTIEPSRTVAVPRVAESPVAIECGLHTTLELGDSTVVIGRVRHIAIDESVLKRDFSKQYQPDESVREAWLAIYRDTATYWDLYELAEELVDLEDWFQRERNRWLEWSGRPIKEIRFWSEALCKNNAEPVVTGR